MSSCQEPIEDRVHEGSQAHTEENQISLCIQEEPVTVYSFSAVVEQITTSLEIRTTTILTSQFLQVGILHRQSRFTRQNPSCGQGCESSSWHVQAVSRTQFLTTIAVWFLLSCGMSVRASIGLLPFPVKKPARSVWSSMQDNFLCFEALWIQEQVSPY